MVISPRTPALACLLGLAACGAGEAPPAPAPAPAVQPTAAPTGSGLAGLFGRKQPEWRFDFKDPRPGPRAPVTAAMHAEVGLHRVADAEALAARLGLTCGDTSIRASMEGRRKAERKRIEEARARGEDAVTAASWLDRKSKREANPQVRFSCPKTRSEQLTDRPRPPSEGRLLFVFDSAEHPLRHVSYQRTAKDPAPALADYQDAVAHYTRVYGPPTRVPARELPAPAPDGTIDIPVATNFETEWAFSDLLVKVSLLRYASLITVGERVEVPPGIRPDAPRLGKPAPADADPPAAPSPSSVSPTSPPPLAAGQSAAPSRPAATPPPAAPTAATAG
ncbi:hypothetical protein SAMN02745121_03676 [Nannocystis exedens]|uniref:Lipoprotein n=1 Tax=Nannocystis exedens TaxID=54 RepID=A0A1I1Z7I1_9BACT|nr:hypothetical protein [Nannocystis exedens]PCC75116.1 hypothetical protein NAEX_08222 [Nannocystis exedens]SFE27701.1 hypothetical protein SAMN02745121_03676 [Nannocystis exedens]